MSRDFTGSGGHPPSSCQGGKLELTTAPGLALPTLATGIPEGFPWATAGGVTPRGAEPQALASAMTTNRNIGGLCPLCRREVGKKSIEVSFARVQQGHGFRLLTTICMDANTNM